MGIGYRWHWTLLTGFSLCVSAMDLLVRDNFDFVEYLLGCDVLSDSPVLLDRLFISLSSLLFILHFYSLLRCYSTRNSICKISSINHCIHVWEIVVLSNESRCFSIMFFLDIFNYSSGVFEEFLRFRLLHQESILFKQFLLKVLSKFPTNLYTVIVGLWIFLRDNRHVLIVLIELILSGIKTLRRRYLLRIIVIRLMQV